MLPEEKARVKIDKQLNNAGWDIVDRKDYLPNYAMAVKEALMQGGKESDYLLFVDNTLIYFRIEMKYGSTFLKL